MRRVVSSGPIVLALAAACVVVAAAPPARAEDPWAVGVTPERKQRAQKLLDEGNTQFLARDFTAALDTYRKALEVWDHPAIRFNIVRCLIQLDRTVEAEDNLRRALAYGEAPLEPGVYAEARAYEKLLAARVGELVVACKQAGVSVTLDGKAFMTCPGTTSRRVGPGEHQLVGAGRGLLPKTIEVVVIGGGRQQVDVTLVRLEQAARVTRRWAVWKPWAALGGGLALASIGGLFQLKAAADMRSFDDAIALQCQGDGCTEDELAAIGELESSARLENRLAIGLISVGVAAAVAGGVLLYVNRARTVYAPAVERSGPRARIDIVPRAGGAAVVASGSF